MKRLATVVALLIGFAAPAAWPQSQAPAPAPSAPAKQKPPAKVKKVWTEDDISAVRKPWDDHIDKKDAEAKAAADKAAADATAQAAGTPAGAAETQAPIDPKTVEEAEQLVAMKTNEVAGYTTQIEETNVQLGQAEDDNTREILRKTVQDLTANKDRAAAELKVLETKLQQLKPAQQPAPAKDPGKPEKPDSQ